MISSTLLLVSALISGPLARSDSMRLVFSVQPSATVAGALG